MQDTMLYVKDTANIQINSILYRKIVPVRCTTLNLCYCNSISKMSVEPPGMPGCENLPYPISAGM